MVPTKADIVVHYDHPLTDRKMEFYVKVENVFN